MKLIIPPGQKSKEVKGRLQEELDGLYPSRFQVTIVESNSIQNWIHVALEITSADYHNKVSFSTVELNSPPATDLARKIANKTDWNIEFFQKQRYVMNLVISRAPTASPTHFDPPTSLKVESTSELWTIILGFVLFFLFLLVILICILYQIQEKKFKKEKKFKEKKNKK
eukprot:TRINITY_DN6818_c0_g1_i1.p1 TRINITY_DN6818_c0_g1~~TRINITY_DN6818_c0_g1_i1.p1  ORF type:complete len:169 (+),score=12.05 TRINITY_DN6818_c0_g1_i1:195-701(+)